MKVIVLFDVDGTLTKPRNKVTNNMLNFLESLHNVVDIGIVGGSDLHKIKEQLGSNLLEYKYIDYVFSENGVLAYKNNELFNNASFSDYIGEEKLKEFINFCLHYIADCNIPVKRGTFIEYRQSMLNVSPIGRNCSQEERDEFEKYDQIYNIRKNMIEVLKTEFPNLPVKYSIGGQISFDVIAWDKTYCLQFLNNYDKIYFFGDKTLPGGNDYEIYNSPLVIGNHVNSPEETIEQCKNIFF
jgi:phosphomannomutase